MAQRKFYMIINKKFCLDELEYFE